LGISEEIGDIYLNRKDYYFCNMLSSGNIAYGLARPPALAMFPDCHCPILQFISNSSRGSAGENENNWLLNQREGPFV